MGELLSLRLDDPDANPYFLWSENLTIAQLHGVLAGDAGREQQLTYMARVLREARYADVWQFLTPEIVASNWPELKRRLGRSRGFWEFLLTTWRRRGLLAG